MNQYITTGNNSRVALESIPVLPYEDFLEVNVGLVKKESNHCVQYFGFNHKGRLRLTSCIADDTNASIMISSCELTAASGQIYPSLTRHHLGFHLYERILHENFGVAYADHPWL
ncbi:MAG TPA: hypothetical protein VIQ51_18350, partial [Chryseosolibacter sp.]